MKERARLWTAGVLVLGGLVGWLAGSGCTDGHLIAADSPSTPLLPIANTRCSAGSGRSVLLAAAASRHTLDIHLQESHHAQENNSGTLPRRARAVIRSRGGHEAQHRDHSGR